MREISLAILPGFSKMSRRLPKITEDVLKTSENCQIVVELPSRIRQMKSNEDALLFLISTLCNTLEGSYRGKRHKLASCSFPPIIYQLFAYQAPARRALECYPVYTGQAIIWGDGSVVFKSSRFHGACRKFSISHIFCPRVHSLKR